MCSSKKMQAKIVTITVQRGLNIAENRGPLLDMHHACAKKVIADVRPYVKITFPFKISNIYKQNCNAEVK